MTECTRLLNLRQRRGWGNAGAARRIVFWRFDPCETRIPRAWHMLQPFLRAAHVSLVPLPGVAFQMTFLPQHSVSKHP